MRSTHLTELQLEQLVLEPSASNEEILTHLQNCVLCQKELETCRGFFSKLKQQREESFDFDLSLLVLNQLKQHEATRQRYKAILILFGLCLIALPVSYFSAETIISSKTINLAAIWLIVISSFSVLLGVGLQHYRTYIHRLSQLN